MVALCLVAFAGCEDDTARLLSEAGINETQSAQTQPTSTNAALSAPGSAPELDTRPELPGGLGRYDLIHEPDRGEIQLRCSDAQPGVATRLKSAALSLAGPQGPTTLELRSETTDEGLRLIGRGDDLRRSPIHGILRYEIDGRRFRAVVSTRKSTPRNADEASEARTQQERHP